MTKSIATEKEKKQAPNWMNCNCLCHGDRGEYDHSSIGKTCPHCSPDLYPDYTTEEAEKEKILEEFEYRLISGLFISGGLWLGSIKDEVTGDRQSPKDFLSQSLDHIASVARQEGREEAIETVRWQLSDILIAERDKGSHIDLARYIKDLAKLTTSKRDEMP